MGAEADNAAPAVDTTTSSPSSTPAAPAPAIEATPTASTPAPSSPAPSTSTPAPAVEKSPSWPAPDSFTWDDWDGAHDKLPEPVRGWAARLEGHYTKESQAIIAEANSLRETYERLSAGLEDPRLATTKAEYDKLKAEHDAKSAEYAEKLAAFEAYQKHVEAQVEAQVSQAQADFKAKHAWIFDGGKVEQAASDLVDEGFGMLELPQVLALPEFLQAEVRKVNKQLQADGVKGAAAHAIRLAKAEAKFQPAPSEELQAGPANRVTSKVTTEQPKTNDFAEARKRAVEKANAAMKVA